MNLLLLLVQLCTQCQKVTVVLHTYAQNKSCSGEICVHKCAWDSHYCWFRSPICNALLTMIAMDAQEVECWQISDVGHQCNSPTFYKLNGKAFSCLVKQ